MLLVKSFFPMYSVAAGLDTCNLQMLGLMSIDFYRNFLRLGDPLCCALNDITEDELGDIASANRMNDLSANGEQPEGYSTPPEQAVEQQEECTTPQPTAQLSMFSRLPHTAGEPLSLARIQSLVSMTTPRDGILSGFGTGACPPFVEFDMSIDGFGSLFIPSVFPQVSGHSR